MNIRFLLSRLGKCVCTKYRKSLSVKTMVRRQSIF